jgi:hypothetical protein
MLLYLKLNLVNLFLLVHVNLELDFLDYPAYLLLLLHLHRLKNFVH